MSEVAKIAFTNYAESVPKALDAIGAADRLPRRGLIIIKPNLTTSDPPPVTTPVAAVEAVYDYCKDHCPAEVAIGEGAGGVATADTFEANGYSELAGRRGIRLIDFNESPAVTVRRDDAAQLAEFHIPRVAREAFVISVPVLKDHHLTTTTISMKNMFGLAPAPYYRGAYNKSKLHSPSVHKSVFDVCLHKPPGLSVIDASVALKGSEISGKPVTLGLILASFDPVAADAVGSRLLGHDPKAIEYLVLADGVLGKIDGARIIEG